ncbi:MAG: CopG family transcriptional regulator [Terriglobia bacterium]
MDLDAGLLRALRHRAARMNRSLSDLINATVRQSLAEDLEDLAEFNERAKEPNLALEAVLKDSRRRGKL